jgi:hypothetical protein
MTKDFEKYQNIMKQFRGSVLDSQFESKFNAATKALEKSEKFILKMEIKRLDTSCTRGIDLRGLVGGECQVFEYDGRSHFLDDLAIQVFKEQIGHYEKYTFGVYESVLQTKNNFRVLYKENKENAREATVQPDSGNFLEKTQYPATLFQLGQYFDRKEERMNFAITLSLIIDNKTEFESTSSDISINGCRFRVNQGEKFEIGQLIDIIFSGLEEDFEFGKDNNYRYEVKNITVDGQTQLIGVQRIETENPQFKSGDPFKKFLAGFIQGNKRRYKVNLDNSISALSARSYEQFVVPKTTNLAVFLEQSDNALLPRYALTCDNNQAIFQYWQDEKGDSTLSFLLNASRLKYLQGNIANPSKLLVYSFVHQTKGNSYFYSADEQELKQDPAFMSDFLAFAAEKPSFSITELTLTPLDHDSVNSPLTVANTLPKKEQYLNLPFSKEVLTIISKLPYLVEVADLTDDNLVAAYKTLPVEKVDIAKIKQFGHKRLKEPLAFNELGINYKNHRQELRFKYKTPAMIEAGGVQWIGISNDFSISGLQIKLEKSSILKVGDVVNLHFPNLQKMTSAFDLKELPYVIVKIDKSKKVISLRVYVKQHQHIGRAFFKLLIEKNKSKLTLDEYGTLIPGLPKALRNLYANHLSKLTVVIQISGSRYKMEAMTSSRLDHDLLPNMRELSESKKQFNLYPLLSNSSASHLINTRLKQLNASDKAKKDILYIAFNHQAKHVSEKVTVKTADELGTEKLKNSFISKALQTGEFFCIQTSVSRTNEPDMEYLNVELSYISNYAIHRGKQLEQDILSVKGVLQLENITQEAMIRYKVFA